MVESWKHFKLNLPFVGDTGRDLRGLGLRERSGLLILAVSCLNPMVLRSEDTTLLSLYSTSRLAPSKRESWVSKAFTRPSAPLSFNRRSDNSLLAASREISRFFFWSSNFFSQWRLSSIVIRKFFSFRAYSSWSSAILRWTLANSLRRASRLASVSTTCKENGQNFFSFFKKSFLYWDHWNLYTTLHFK